MRGFGSLSVWSSLGVVALASIVTLGTAACGDSESTDGSGGTASTGSDTGGSTTSGMGGMATSSGTGAGGPSCDTPNPAHGGNEFAPGTVTALLLDQDGAAAADAKVQLCGTDLCIVDSNSGVDGSVSMAGGADTTIDPAIKYGKGGAKFAKFAALVETPNEAFGTINIIKMPATGAALAEGDNTSAEVTVTLEAGTDIRTELDLQGDDLNYRAAVISLTANPTLVFPALDDSLNLEMLVAVTPQDTLVCPGADLSFPNTESWADGSDVEIYIHGTRTFNHYAPYGEWSLIAEATVNGNRVELKDGESVEVLGVFGARPKP